MTPPPPAVHPPKTPAGSCEQVYNSELGPFPEYLVVGPQPTSAIKASGNGSKIGTEVVYVAKEQTELMAKVNKITPLVKVLGATSGVMILVIAGWAVYLGLNSVQP